MYAPHFMAIHIKTAEKENIYVSDTPYESIFDPKLLIVNIFSSLFKCVCFHVMK